jgi:hypothetical protein
MSVAALPLPQREPIAFQWACHIGDDAADVEEIVEGVLTAGGMSVWYGEPNCGKTTLLLDLAMRMPSGLPWLGRRTQKGTVIYVALEGAGSVKRRLCAYRKHHDTKVGLFGVVSSPLNLMDPSADVEDLLDLIESAKSELLESEPPLRLIVIDTVARAMGGANENASEDMARLISAGDHIRQKSGAHVAFVHHSGKDASKGARGHSSLRGAVDTEVEITADRSAKTHTAEVVKQRDLDPLGLKLTARFVPVELGTNQWGNPVTACVVEMMDEPSAHMQAVMKSVEDQRAEATVLSGFRRLLDIGIQTVDGVTSKDFLPSQLLAKGFAEGFSKAQLAEAMHRLMAQGVFVRGPVGTYASGAKRDGLVLADRGAR